MKPPRRGTVAWIEAQDERVVRQAARVLWHVGKVPQFVSEIISGVRQDGEIRRLCELIEKEIGHQEGAGVMRALRDLPRTAHR